MNTHGYLSPILTRLSLLLAFASTTLVAAENDRSSPLDGGVVQLSPFVVNGDKDNGYAAASTLAGSRLNTDLKDTAASISVMTADLIKDIGALNVTEAIEYGTNIQLDRDGDQGPFGSEPLGNDRFSSFDTYRVRGIRATTTRNYFEWFLPADSYNIERIEEARGPNSILFGIGSPGGVVNFSTKQAITGRTFGNVSAMFDDHSSYRGTLDYNQSLANGRLAIRLNTVYSDTNDGLHFFQYDNQKRLHLAVTFNITPKTRIRAEYETGLVVQNKTFLGTLIKSADLWDLAGRPTFATPVTIPAQRLAARNATAHVVYIGNDNRIINTAQSIVTTNGNNMYSDFSIADPSINVAGPGSITRSGLDTGSVYLEHQFGRNTFLEIAYNKQKFNFSGTQPFGDGSGTTLLGEPNQTFRNGQANPYAGDYYLEANANKWIRNFDSDNVRAMLTTELDAGKWGHYRVGVMGERQRKRDRSLLLSEVWAGAPFNAQPENAANSVYRRNYITKEGDWASYHIPMPLETGPIVNMTDPVTGRTLSSTWVPFNSNVVDDPAQNDSWLVMAQAHYFSDRLVLGAGYRKDKVHVRDNGFKRDPKTNIWVVDYDNVTDIYADGGTRTLSAVGHLTKNISVLYNNSTNIGLQNATTKVLPDGKAPPPSHAKGEDVGVNLSFFDGRINARASYYQSASQGLSGARGVGSTDTNPSSFTVFILDALRTAGAITQAQQDAHTLPPLGQATWDESSKGYEFNLTANPTKNWRLMANWSQADGSDTNLFPELLTWWAVERPYFESFHLGGLVTNRSSKTIDQVIETFQDAIDAQVEIQGVGKVGQRRHKVSLFTRYGFSDGPLKGFYIGGGYKYQSPMLIGRQIDAGGAFQPYPTGALLYGNSYWLADALLGYTIPRIGFVKNVNLQLNVTNLFDDDTPLTLRVNPNGELRRWSVALPRTIRFTTTIPF